MNRKTKHFTLIELLMVVGIIGILATVSFASYGYVQAYLARQQTQTMLTTLREAINNYYQDNNTWPDVFRNEKLYVMMTPESGAENATPEPGSLTDMKKNVIIKAEDFKKTKRFMYFSGEENAIVSVQDMWGEDIIARRSAVLQKSMNEGRVQNSNEATLTVNNASFDLISKGPDKTEGDKDGKNDDIRPIGEES